MDNSTTDWAWPWWTVLVVINAANLLICLYLYSRSARSDALHTGNYRKYMRTLGLIFIMVAAYRSVFVSSYLEQLAWFDTLANSSLLIRFFAFFAELSFAGLFMFALLQINRDIPVSEDAKANGFTSFLYSKTPFVLFGCIFMAQFFATTALITKFELFFAIEESLWALAFLAVTPLALNQLQRVKTMQDSVSVARLKMLRVFTLITASWCVLYCSYALVYHLPIELWPHVIADLQSGTVVIKTGTSAIRDAFLVVNETKDFNAWGGMGFLIWHSGYFSICGWIVLFLMSGPRMLREDERWL
ncbi:MAG: hypothetical protein V7754_16955 [Halioglobus sp.]